MTRNNPTIDNKTPKIYFALNPSFKRTIPNMLPITTMPTLTSGTPTERLVPVANILTKKILATPTVSPARVEKSQPPGLTVKSFSPWKYPKTTNIKSTNVATKFIIKALK